MLNQGVLNYAVTWIGGAMSDGRHRESAECFFYFAQPPLPVRATYAPSPVLMISPDLSKWYPYRLQRGLISSGSEHQPATSPPPSSPLHHMHPPNHLAPAQSQRECELLCQLDPIKWLFLQTRWPFCCLPGFVLPYRLNVPRYYGTRASALQCIQDIDRFMDAIEPKKTADFHQLHLILVDPLVGC